jgi:hypothetical protein
MDNAKTFIILGIIACIVIAVLAGFYLVRSGSETKQEPAEDSLGSELKQGVRVLTDPEGVAKEQEK